MSTLPANPAAIIFDLDGTLLDTEPLFFEAVQEMLDPHGHTYTAALQRQLMGGDARRSARAIIETFELPMTPGEYLAQREIHLRRLFPRAVEMPGAGAYLRHLHRRRIPMGLATSSHRHLCDLKIGHRGWYPLLATVVCGDDAELKRSKPEPDIFLLTAARMNADPSRVIAFEDSRNGINAAKGAGMFVVALESPHTEPEDLQAADITIGSYHTLM